MLSPRLLERLNEPNYLDLHLKALATLRGVAEPTWYDAQFLVIYEAARRFISLVRPDRLKAFERGFEILRTPRDFQIRKITNLLDASIRSLVKEAVDEIAENQLERHELTSFGRFVLHDHPFFTELQEELLPEVSRLAGCDLETGYNFLSLYGRHGKCDLHMDHPLSMFTLDYCIDTDVEWPIHFSKVIDWPSLDNLKEWGSSRIMEDPDLAFESHVIEPNDAVLFSGSAQWHYRDPIPPGGSATLLFFHFYPRGANDLVYFGSWPDRFDIPELEALCDIFAERYPQLEASGHALN